MKKPGQWPSPIVCGEEPVPRSLRGNPDTAGQDRTIRLEPLTNDLQTQLLQPSECGQVRAGEGSVRHGEVFLMGGVRTPIIGRPRPLPSDRRADQRLALLFERREERVERLREALDAGRQQPVGHLVEGDSHLVEGGQDGARLAQAVVQGQPGLTVVTKGLVSLGRHGVDRVWPDQRVDVGLIRVIARWIKGGSKGGALKTASNRASY